MDINGAQILVQSLKEQNVEVVFGYPGGAVLEIIDALQESSIKQILVRHEQGGAHAASGYARATGRVGVCLATSGPGATNLVTGIATAYMDSVPLVFITGQVPKIMVGTDAFQEVDITGITSPITKYNYLVQDVNDLSRIVTEAFYIAKSGRPGPVLIDIPRDVAMAKTQYKSYPKVDIRSYKPTIKGHLPMIKKAVQILREANNPVICTGGGVISSESTALVQKLVEVSRAKVVSTLMGLGAFPGNHPAFLGMLGTYGKREANLAVQNCDCFLALGMRFDDRVVGSPEKFAPKATIIHIDVDPAEIGKNIPVEVPIVGDLKKVLEQMLSCWPQEENKSKGNLEIAENKEVPERFTAPWIIENIRKIVPENTIITTDVGQHQIWTALHYSFNKPRTLISSGGLGTMGYGIPAAVGVQIAKPDNLVLAITGDGSFQMGMPELGTIAERELPIKILVFNNRTLGMVRQLQHYYCGRRYSFVDFQKLPDFMTLAQAYGAKGYRLEKTEGSLEILKEAFTNKQFSIIEFVLNPEDLVSPIVLAGNGLEEMTF